MTQPMTMSEIRSFLNSGDEALRSQAVLVLLDGTTDRAAYRVALAYLEGLTLDQWTDWVAVARETRRARSEQPTLHDGEDPVGVQTETLNQTFGEYSAHLVSQYLTEEELEDWKRTKPMMSRLAILGSKGVLTSALQDELYRLREEWRVS